jgi:hypothetical protein
LGVEGGACFAAADSAREQGENSGKIGGLEKMRHGLCTALWGVRGGIKTAFNPNQVSLPSFINRSI